MLKFNSAVISMVYKPQWPQKQNNQFLDFELQKQAKKMQSGELAS